MDTLKPEPIAAVMFAGALCLAAPAAAQQIAAAAPPPGQEPSAPDNPKSSALRFQVSYYGDLFADLDGGLQTGSTYQGRLGLILDADLQELIGWQGATAHASVHQIHGQGLTAGHVGALMTVSGLEAEPTTRLFNLWIEQTLGDRAALKIGQFTAGQEFFISANAAAFVNATFGWPAIVAQDLPSGGPAYPLATPGVRLSYRPDGGTTLMMAIFNGDPAGPGGGDPQRRDRTGLNSFRLSGRPFLIGEAQWVAGPRDNPDAMFRLGAWAYLGDVADQRRDDRNGLLADPRGSGVPARRRGDHGVYGVLDAVLARNGDRVLSGFLRAAASPSDRNLIDAYADVGLTYKGLLPDRPADLAGLAIGYSRISSGARARDADSEAFAGAGLPIRDRELVLEASYQAQVTASWSIQPDLQLILSPGGGGAAQGTLAPIPDAVIAGVRNVVKF